MSAKAVLVENPKDVAAQAATQEEPGPSPNWVDRLGSLRKHTPMLFHMVWDAAPGIVVSSLAARFIASLLPLAMLAVTGTIIERIHKYTSHQSAAAPLFLVARSARICAG